MELQQGVGAVYRGESLTLQCGAFREHDVAARGGENTPNFVLSWHGSTLERLSSDIYQDLALRRPDELITPAFNESI